MRTDELVAMLGTNVERVDRRQVKRTIGVVIALAIVAALGSSVFVLGIRTGLNNSSDFPGPEGGFFYGRRCSNLDVPDQSRPSRGRTKNTGCPSCVAFRRDHDTCRNRPRFRPKFALE